MDFSIQEMIWSIINFLVLVAILNILLFKPMMKALDARHNEIKDNLDNAAKDRDEARKIKEEYTSHLHNVKVEARDIIANANKLGEENKNEIMAQAKAEADSMITKSRKEIAEEKQKALAEIRDEVAVLSVMTAEKIIGKNINIKDQERLVKDFIEEVGETH